MLLVNISHRVYVVQKPLGVRDLYIQFFRILKSNIILGHLLCRCIKVTWREILKCELEGVMRNRIIAKNNMLNISGWLTADCRIKM